MKRVWYFPLEEQKERYTKQLCGDWMINAFQEHDIDLRLIEGESVPKNIRVGSVLDATGRGIYSLTQCREFLQEIENGSVQTGDVIFLQDFWTPGLEAIWYALHLYNIQVDVYSMCHAQSVDEYDFTYPMRNWMRHYELGLDKYSKGIFVASSIHKQQLREAGFKSNIHVVGLPINFEEVKNRIDYSKLNTQNSVVFCSRLDYEKQPYFMMETAKRFLERNPSAVWYVTTSAPEFRSNMDNVVKDLYRLSNKYNNFILKKGITKDEYYEILTKSKVQFNCSLQDYVSWTLLESCIAGCDLAYPDYRSFPECVPDDRRYEAFNEDKAVKMIETSMQEQHKHYNIPLICDKGRLKEVDILVNGSDKEVNIWNEVNL